MRRRQVSRTQATSLARRFTNSGPVLPFNPASIPGCQLWLDAADSSSILMDSSSNVSLWIDKSSYENNFSLTSGTTSKINDGGYSVINFPSGATMSSAKQITFTTSSAFFIVSKLTSLSASTISMVVGFTNMYDGDYTFVRYNPSTILNGTAATTTNERDVGNNNYYVNGTFNPSTFGSNYYLNTYSIIGTVSPTTSGTSYLTLSSAFSSRYFIGNIAEFLYYPTGLTTIQRQKVEGYLASKWGLQTSLPSNHPYKTTAPTYEEPIFLPTLISGSRIWLDASDDTKITLSGSSVTQIVDKSSNGYAFTGSTGTYPTRTTTLNGIPVISSSSGKYLQNTSFNQNFTTATFFAVIRPTQDITPNGISGGYAQHLIVYGTSLGDFAFVVTYANQAQTGDPSKFFIEVDKAGTGFINGALGGASPSTYNPVNTPLNIGAVMTGSSTTNSAYLNGSSVNLTYNVSGTFPLQSGITVRCFAGFGCDYAEILVYGSVLTSVERQRIEGYLAQKWGLQSSLPVNHPYKTIAPTGIPKSVTIQSLSALFNTANNSSLSIPASSALTLGTNDHTIEFCLYQTSRDQYNVAFSYGNTSLFAGNNYFMNVGTYIGIVIGNGGGWAVNIDGGQVAPLNTWNHYAVVRSGTTFTFYLNGTNRGSATSSVNIPAQGDVFRIGNTTTYPIAGYISNFRVVNGTAVYTSNFTPPTSPLTAIPNTQILIQGLVDRSPNAFTVTNNGSVALSTSMSPFV
jgi:hypothetical protein